MPIHGPRCDFTLHSRLHFIPFEHRYVPLPAFRSLRTWLLLLHVVLVAVVYTRYVLPRSASRWPVCYTCHHLRRTFMVGSPPARTLPTLPARLLHTTTLPTHLHRGLPHVTCRDHLHYTLIPLLRIAGYIPSTRWVGLRDAPILRLPGPGYLHLPTLRISPFTTLPLHLFPDTNSHDVVRCLHYRHSYHAVLYTVILPVDFTFTSTLIRFVVVDFYLYRFRSDFDLICCVRWVVRIHLYIHTTHLTLHLVVPTVTAFRRSHYVTTFVPSHLRSAILPHSYW